MLDDMLDYVQTLRERPAWQHIPDKKKSRFRQPLPVKPQSREKIYEDFLENILPYPMGNSHPRFWGWVLGTGTVFGGLADMLASLMNTNSGGLDQHSANHVESQVIVWIKEMLAYPETASGLLTSGCSAANLIGLAVARNTKANYDLRMEGVNARQGKMTLYASEEIHSSIQKAVEILGLGGEALRLIPTNDKFEINVQLLKEKIRQDRAEGHHPFCIVGAVGTTNTGAVDDHNQLADICAEEGLWLHVDGAFGAWAALSPKVRDIVSGMDRADSLAVDLHKWMYMPFEIGCVLVKDEQAHRQTFTLTPDYLAHGSGERGMTGGDLPWYSDYGFQLSREFRALKAWMSIKEHGSLKYGRLIQQNIDQAQYLAGLILADADMELMAPVTLNVVCFRWAPPGAKETELDQANRNIIIELQERGNVVISGTIIRGKYVMHVAQTNHRSRREDFDLLLQEVKLVAEENINIANS
jgi:glutamate/tyrosine decarboxylase-like PLP-dependent enzyme